MSNQWTRPELLQAANSSLTGSPRAAQRQVYAAKLRERLWSRRRFLRRAAGAAGAVLGAQLFLPGLARADHDDDVFPTPIPETLVLGGTPFHVVGLGPADQGNEPSVITDFKGFVGVAGGGGTGTDENGDALTLSFDYRFMKGEYVGVDGRRHQGAFAFI
jgi:hypothetical protein